MDIGRLVITIVVAAVVMFILDIIVHGLILGSQYGATAESWRPEEEMAARRPLQFLCYFVIAIGFCTVWAVGFASHGHGLKCGAIYGFFMGLFGTGGMTMSFVFSPIPDQFMVPWIISGLLSAVIIGVVTACVYKPKTTAATADKATS
jgi:hypothetical protein